MKRHDSQEVSTKLRLADDKMKAGKSQKDICKLLGISVMTFHRWRKLAASPDASPQLSDETEDNAARTNGFRHSSQIDGLKLENQRLRRIVSDLLLETLKVQELLDRTTQ